MMESKKVMDSMIYYARKSNFPLLLIYGGKDNLVDKKGCDMIYDNWKNMNKKYVVVANGTHGKSTLLGANHIIKEWINNDKARCNTGRLDVPCYG